MKPKTKFTLFLFFIVICILVSIFSGYFGLNPSAIGAFISLNHGLAALLFVVVFGVGLCDPS